LTDNGPNPSLSGTAVSFTTTVTPASGSPINGEQVDIEDASNGNAVVATPTIVNGTATFTISNLSVGSHNLFAVYGGDSTDASSQSSQVDQVVQSTFQVVTSVATPNGVVFTFNAPVALSSTHLYNSPVSALGAPDVTVVGDSTGIVEGSLVIDPIDPYIATFVETAAPLATDTYTATVTTGVTAVGGATLSSNYTNLLSVTAPTTPVLSVPSFARGPGQTVNVPNTGSGIPVSITNGSNVTQASLTLTYDPTLLTIAATGAIAPSSAASAVGLTNISYSITSVDANHSILTASISGGSGLTAGTTPVALLDIAATVPNTALYLNKAVLNLGNVLIDSNAATGISGIDEDAYLGDVNGDETITAQDALLVLQDATGLGSGFDAYADLDPIIVGDANGSGQLTTPDALQILKASVGDTVAQIPAIPSLLSTISAASWSSNTDLVTITSAAANNFAVGQTVVIAGMTPSGYNGTYTINSIIDSTDFTYSLSSDPGSATAFGTATLELATGQDPQLFFPNFSVVAGQSTAVSLWMTNTSGQPLPLTSLDEAILFNQNEFTISNVVKGSLLSGGWMSAANVSNTDGFMRVAEATATPIVVAGGTITAANWSKGAVTVTTSSANDFVVGQTVVIEGMTPLAFDGTFTVASVIGPKQFTYALSANPGIARAYGIAGASGPVLTFTVTAGARAGGTTTPLNLARSVSSNGSTTYTDAYSNAGELTLNPAPTNAANDPGVDGALSIERTQKMNAFANAFANSSLTARSSNTNGTVPIAVNLHDDGNMFSPLGDFVQTISTANSNLSNTPGFSEEDQYTSSFQTVSRRVVVDMLNTMFPVPDNSSGTAVLDIIQSVTSNGSTSVTDSEENFNDMTNGMEESNCTAQVR
jgi:hypothetical protein